MKNILIILLALFIASCNPFISKDLRQKNKCNRKIERELKRHKKKAAKINVICPGAIVKEIIHDTIEVEIPIPSTDIDSFIVIENDSAKVDSLLSLIRNNKTREVIREYFTKYVPIKDTIIHLTDGYTIKFWSKDGKINYTIDKPAEIKVVEVPTETVVEQLKPLELTNWQTIMNGAKDFWWILVLFIALFLIARLIWKRIKGN